MGVKVKQLVWVTEEKNWWAAQPEVMINRCGYEVRVTDHGMTRIRRGTEDWRYFEGTVKEAKAFWQNDFEDRVLSSLEMATEKQDEFVKCDAWLEHK